MGGSSSGATGADGTAGGSTATEGGETTGPPPTDGPRYGDVVQKSSHNSFQRAEALVDQLGYHRVRSLELDLHVGKTFERSVDGNWFVYHTDIIDDATSCRLLSDCLDETVAFAQAVPEHEVITLWLDLKDDWSAGHLPADLDAMLDARLGAAVLSPVEVRARCPGASSLAAAVTDPACGWPSLASLRGRVIVVLTGGTIEQPQAPLSTYVTAGTRAFVAPSITRPGSLRVPSPSIAIYNANASDTGAIAAAAEAGFVVRAWDANTRSAWTPAREAGARHLATNAINLHQDPWTVTHDGDGWPFSCVDGCAGAGPEPGALIGIRVDSGDIWGTADAMVFAHHVQARPGGQWSALVSTPNSWVDPFAKGCLMARAGLDPDAAYFAVCRPADDEPLRTQLRAAAGEGSTATEHDVVPPQTVAPSSAAWVRLEVDASGLCATGYGAWRRDSWVEIDSHCFEQPLTHQGLAASSHDDGMVKLLFLDPRHDGRTVSADALTETAVGGAVGEVFDGPFP